jgi:hypothetical protein
MKDAKGSWTNIRDLLVNGRKEAGGKLQVQGNAGAGRFRAADGACRGFIMRGCATVKGEQKTVSVSERAHHPGRRFSRLLRSFKDANAGCDAVFSPLTDAAPVKPITGGRGDGSVPASQ